MSCPHNVPKNCKELKEAENRALIKLKKLVKDTSIYTTDLYALQMAKFLQNTYKATLINWNQALTKYLYKI